jgi:hypothetical protein
MRERIGQRGQSLDMRERIGQQGQSYLTAAEKVWRVGLEHLVFSRSTMHQLFSKSTKEFLANRERDLSRHCTLTTYLRDRSSYGPCVVLLMSADLKSYGSAAILQPSLPPTFVSRSDFPYYNPDTSHRKVFPYLSPRDSPRSSVGLSHGKLYQYSVVVLEGYI